MANASTATRARLIARAAKLFATQYPVAYTSAEAGIILGIPERTARRVVADLLSEQIIERYYTAYRLHTRIVDCILNQKLFAQKDKEKDICLNKKK